MYEIAKKLWVLQAVEGITFCRYLLQKCGYDVERGFIIVADDDLSARQIAAALLETIDAKEIKHWNSKAEKPLNFRCGIRLCKSNDKAEELTDFLSQRSFFPLVIVGGIVPECLWNQGLVFRLRLTEKDIRDSSKLYVDLKKSVLQNLAHMQYEIQHASTSRLAQEFSADCAYYKSFQALLAVGKIWAAMFREKNSEADVENWLGNYCKCMAEELECMDDFFDSDDIVEAVSTCVVSFVEDNPLVQVKTIENITFGDAENEKFCIYTDENFYFITDSLLKNICLPLLETIAFFQLKEYMRQGGKLLCNQTKNGNFTIKIRRLDPESGRILQRRFLKVSKDFLLTEDGLALEDIVEFRDKEED